MFSLSFSRSISYFKALFLHTVPTPDLLERMQCILLIRKVIGYNAECEWILNLK